jgi:S-formylglutathione hydrolase
MSNAELIAENKVFGGWQRRYLHTSTACQCPMHFSVYVPPQVEEQRALPVLYWLSGLTCTDENFVQKAGAQRYAAQHGVIVVAPDTSPRGEPVADMEQEWDIGQGAGFYLNATQPPWSAHYQMYSYIVDELPALINSLFTVDEARVAISGHSMGGHGALSIAMKNPQRFRSVSAFAPICAPMQCPWGEKAFSTYLGEDRELWKEYDSCELLKDRGLAVKALIDQGSADDFLQEQLKPNVLTPLIDGQDVQITYREQAEYDHSYYFISSFMGEHFEFHFGQ